MRAALAVLTSLSVLAVAVPLATAAPRSESPYVPVTPTEKRLTRPLVDLVLAAHASGDYTRLCDVWSLQAIRASFGTRARCRSEATRRPGRRCKTCAYGARRALGLYKTASDRKERRKSIVWLVPVKGDPQLKNGSLEIRCRQEQGRWVVTAVLQDGSTG